MERVFLPRRAPRGKALPASYLDPSQCFVLFLLRATLSAFSPIFKITIDLKATTYNEDSFTFCGNLDLFCGLILDIDEREAGEMDARFDPDTWRS
jgi:hypothetical protein